MQMILCLVIAWSISGCGAPPSRKGHPLLGTWLLGGPNQYQITFNDETVHGNMPTGMLNSYTEPSFNSFVWDIEAGPDNGRSGVVSLYMARTTCEAAYIVSDQNMVSFGDLVCD